MRRALVMLTIAWFLALGTGAAEWAHNAQHASEDARLAHPDQSAPVHDDTNCQFHAQLHQPIIATPALVLLICAGLFVAFVTQLAPVTDSLRLPARIDCRGPPRLVQPAL